MKPQSQRGVALVITLVMLAVVTFMAITFLAVSRRERASVSVTEEQTTARYMAESAEARAISEVINRMLVSSNLLSYDMMVSTNFISPYGFNPNQSTVPGANFTNVNYDRRIDKRAFTLNDRLSNLTNLFYDPRPPVYLRTTDDPSVPPTAPFDFRFYLDLNRDGKFETNGWRPVMLTGRQVFDLNGRVIAYTDGMSCLSNFFVGDPEWIGVLANPGFPHSRSNHFIGRYAFMVLPMGKSLDINYIHNNARDAKTDPQMQSIRYFRNQGHGSWELNLGAFLRDFRTNTFQTYGYQGFNALFNPNAYDSGSDALGMLRYRYQSNYSSVQPVLAPAAYWFGSNSPRIETDYIDAYANSPPLFTNQTLVVDNDRSGTPGAGSDNPNVFTSFNDFFDTNKVPYHFQHQLTYIAPFGVAPSDYNRYGIYDMLGQLGTDSYPANHDKVNVNYNNLPPYDSTNMAAWTPLGFFTNVAEKLFEFSKSTNIYPKNPLAVPRFAPANLATNYFIGGTVVRPGFSINNILLYSSRTTNRSEYTASTHRLLQVAANMYDATTNRMYGTNALPSVFRPRFGVISNDIYIVGFDEVTNSSFLRRPFRDLSIPADRDALRTQPDDNVYGVGLIIGAKKGLPNFNEFGLQNVAEVSRKVQLTKLSSGETKLAQTNLMYLLSISNQFGIEAWNSYTQTWSRPLTLTAVGDYQQALKTNSATPSSFAQSVVHYVTNMTINAWPGSQFKVPVFRSVFFVPESTYQPSPPQFKPSTTNDTFKSNLGFYVPDLVLNGTNRFYFALIDQQSDRVVDYVSFSDMEATMNITRELNGPPRTPLNGTPEPEFWATNRPGNSASSSVATVGIINQMDVSLGITTVSDATWASYSRLAIDGLDKNKSIDLLRVFSGLQPIYGYDKAQLERELTGKLAFQAAFTPCRKLVQDLSWQANDPLVHYQIEDLFDPFNPPNQTLTNSVRFAVAVLAPTTNANLGLLNDRYRPWGGNPQLTPAGNPNNWSFPSEYLKANGDRQAYDVRLKDPLITRSDDWQFPTNKWPSIGWIGRVHRGTPWQTIYLKSAGITETNGVDVTNTWYGWAGSIGTHPTNDWKILDAFTVAPNDNAARGLISVNQTNLPAWSAVLSGVSVLTNLATVSGTNRILRVQELFIEPEAGAHNNNTTPTAHRPQLRRIVDGINRTRNNQPGQLYPSLGRLLATPELTFASPYLATNKVVDDATLERIPQQILSLVHEDQPRFVVYAFGQTLREAPSSLYMGAGPFNRLCTNYQVTAEFATKVVAHIEGTVNSPRAVVDSYNEVPLE